MAPEHRAEAAVALSIFAERIQDPSWRKRLGAAEEDERAELLEEAGVDVDAIPEPLRSTLIDMPAPELDVIADLFDNLEEAGLLAKVDGTILFYL
jgi:hypothetical protein